MSRFLETIRLENGAPQHLADHARRVAETLAHFFPAATLDLTALTPPAAPPGRAKWRLVYADRLLTSEVVPYTPRPVGSLQAVAVEGSYAYKSLDRRLLTEAFDRRGTADDVLLVRDGLLTDTSIANIALGNAGASVWLTPAAPLLAGTTRARLLAAGRLRPAPLTLADVKRFTHIALFNALLPFGEMILPTACIAPMTDAR